MLALEQLPLLRGVVRAMYQGSIDKLGGNADWDWWLYQQPNGEWVLFDVDGPGCIYNFVQHRYPTSEVPTFRFYFDGESEPRFEIRPEEFGAKRPFVAPLAGYFLGDDAPPRGRGPIRVIRSFVPMPFRTGCKITSSVQLRGADKTKGEGGWGHVIYHTLPTSDGVDTFTGKEDLSQLRVLYSGMGQLGHARSDHREVMVPAGNTLTLLDQAGSGAITLLSLAIMPHDPAWLADLWITARWDNHSAPDIESPLGAFFGNEYGLRSIALLLYGQTPDGRLYCKFPMPFWESARIEIQNRGSRSAVLSHRIELSSGQGIYPRERCGYFRASTYYPPTAVTPGQDSILGEVSGRGHIVAATITGRSIANKYVSCEGDLRLYIDGNQSPQIQSDGSESHACYGWGFVSPGQQNPISGYDGSGEPTCEFSETRSHPGDWIPFQTGFRFGIEAGERNDAPMIHSGLILYYGIDQPGMRLTDTLQIGDAPSEASHAYHVEQQTWHGKLESAYEGNADTVRLTNTGRAHAGRSSFTVQIDPANKGVRLRLRRDQLLPRQKAHVLVDGVRVTEGSWYIPSHNAHYRWHDSEFDIPPRYTEAKDQIEIIIEHIAIQVGEFQSPAWSEFQYTIFSFV